MLLARRSVVVPALVAAVALGLAWPLGGSNAALRDTPAFLFATIGEGDVRGSVAAVQRTGAPRAGVFVSLHGMTPSRSYTGIIADVPCGRSAGRSHMVLDLLGVKKTEAGEDDFFENKTGRLSKKLARGVSVRILREGNEIACARANRVR